MRTTMRTTNDNQSINSMRATSIFGLSPIKDLSINHQGAKDDLHDHRTAEQTSLAHDRSLAIRRARRELRKYSREIALAEALRERRKYSSEIALAEALRERSLNLYRALLAGTREFRLAD